MSWSTAWLVAWMLTSKEMSVGGPCGLRHMKPRRYLDVSLALCLWAPCSVGTMSSHDRAQRIRINMHRGMAFY